MSMDFFNIVGTLVFLILQHKHAANLATEQCLKEAGNKVREHYMKAEPNKWDQDVPIDICVIYDGTWHEHGHSSHDGIGVVVDLATGLLLDYQVLSNHCYGSQIGPSVSSPTYGD